MAGLFDDVLGSTTASQSGSGLFDDVIGKPPATSDTQGDTSRGFTRAFAQIPELAYGAGALASMAAEKLFGEGGLSTTAKDYFASKFAAKQEENQKYAPTVEFTDAWDNLGKDPGKMVDWIQDSAGYVVGQGIQTIATGGLGALAGRMTLGTLVAGSAAKAADKMVAAKVAEMGLTGEAATAMAQSMMPAATAQAARNLTTALGSGAVLMGQNLGMEAGDIYGGLIEESKKTGQPITGADVTRAWLAAGAAAGTETLTDMLGLGALTGRIKIGGKGVSEMTGVGGRLARAGTAAAVGMPVEGGQEWIQTGLEQYGAGKPLDTPEAAKERINAAAVGALGGGLMGGGIGAIQGARNTDEAIRAAQDVAFGRSTDTAAAAIDEFKTGDMGATGLLGAPSAGPTLIAGEAGVGTIEQQAEFAAQQDQARLDAMVQPAPAATGLINSVPIVGEPTVTPDTSGGRTDTTGVRADDLLIPDTAKPATEPLVTPQARVLSDIEAYQAAEQKQARGELLSSYERTILDAGPVATPSKLVTEPASTAEQGTAQRKLEREGSRPVPVTQTQLAQQEQPALGPVPTTVGGVNEAHLDNEQLTAIIANPATHANTRRAAQAVLGSRMSQPRGQVQPAPTQGEQDGRMQGQETAEAVAVKEVFGPDARLRTTTDGQPGEPVTGTMRAALVQLGRLTGTKVVFFDSADADGATRSKDGNTVYINVRAGVSPLQVMGHEVTHVLKRKHRQAWAAIKDVVQASTDNAVLLEFAKDYWSSPQHADKLAALNEAMLDQRPDALGVASSEATIRDFLLDEMISDLGGGRWGDPAFWENVFQKIEQRHGTEQAKGIIQRLVAAVKEMVNKLIVAAKTKGFAEFRAEGMVAQRVTPAQLQEIRSAIEDAYATFISAERRNEPAGYTTGQAAPTPVPGGDVGRELEEMEGTRLTPPRMSDEAKAVWEERGEAAADRQYDLGLKKGQRTKKTTAGLTGDEKLRVARDAKKYGFSVEEVEREVRLIKTNYPASEGWLQPVFNQIAEKGDNLNSRIEFKEIPYSFHLPPGWTSDKAPNPHSKDAAPWVQEMANRVTKEIVDLSHRAAAGDTVAKTIIDHMTWYREMARRLRDEFGGFGDAFADLLGATSPNTPVRTNWNFSVDVLRRFVRGEFDEKLKAYEDAIAQGIGPNEFRKRFDEQLLTQLTGAQYGINSVNAAKALVGLWRAVKKGDAPKARNFALNLIGQSDKATIDVWAARMLQRIAKRDRVPPKAEGAVSGNHAANIENVTGQFGFGQLVFDKAVKQLQAQGVSITAPDLHAVAWFLEKELWTKNGWTRGLGSEGSFEQEADKMPVDRYQAGATIQQTSAPSDAEMGRAREGMTETLRGDADVLAYRALPTVGMYAGSQERSFDQEIIANRGWDPSRWVASVVKVAKASNQYDTFFSRVLQPNEDHPNARPGLEVYFKSQMDMQRILPLLQRITSQGVDGFTLVVDPLQRRSLEGGKQAEKFIGVRLQYVPEIALRWMDKTSEEYRKLTSGDEVQVQEVVADMGAKIDAAVADLEGQEGIAFVKRYAYDTLVIGKENYDAYTDPDAREVDRPFGADASQQPLAERLQAATDRMEGKPERVGQRDVLQRETSRRGQQRRPDAAGGRPAGDSPAQQSLPRYGTPADRHAVSVTGVHYSREQRAELSSAYFGTGMKGQERLRVSYADDPRIKRRLYFYASTGRGVSPESDVGIHAHTVGLDNVYDMDVDPLKLYVPQRAGAPYRSVDQRMNDFESAVIDAGYDGYMTRDFGVGGAVVLLGDHAVPVRYEGAGVRPTTEAAPAPRYSDLQQLRQRIAENRALPSGQMTGLEWKRTLLREMPEVDPRWLENDRLYYKGDLLKGAEDAGVQRSERRLAPNGQPSKLTEQQWLQVRTPEFKAWFGDWEKHAKAANPVGSLWSDPDVSKIVDENGEPLVVYHGTQQGGFDVFRPEKGDKHRSPMLFATADAGTARSYSGRPSEIEVQDEKALDRWEELRTADAYGVRKLTRAERAELRKLDDLFNNENGGDRESQRGIYHLFLNIRNPNEADFEGANWDGQLPEPIYELQKDGDYTGEYAYTLEDAERALKDGRADEYTEVTERFETTNSVAEEALRLGNDGAIIRNVVDDGGKHGYGVDPSDVFVFFDSNQVKSATQNTGAFSRTDDSILRSESRTPTPWYYSELARAVDNAPAKAFTTGKQFAVWIQSNTSKLGVKKQEIEATGLTDWLQTQGKVTREQVAAYLEQGGVQVTETVLGRQFDPDNPTLPDGWEVREIEDDERDGGPTWGRYEYVVTNSYGLSRGFGNSKDDAINDAYSGYPRSFESGEDTKFQQYVLPGAVDGSYREVLLTLPGGETHDQMLARWKNKYPTWREGQLYKDVLSMDDQRAFEAELDASKGNFRSPHFNQPNILAHVRFNERTDAEGRRVLFIEELQSDWAQKGRKEGFNVPVTAYQVFVDGVAAGAPYESKIDAYDHKTRALKYNAPDKVEIREVQAYQNVQSAANKGLVPLAPFVTDTKSWTALALKRMIAHAVEQGFDAIAWTMGEQQAARYDLSTQISSIDSSKTTQGAYAIRAKDLSGKTVVDDVYPADKLEDVVGKDLAKRIVDETPEGSVPGRAYAKTFSGLDLKVGGEGMKAFYDQIVPQVANDVLKKLGGGKVGTVQLVEYDRGTPRADDVELDTEVDRIIEDAFGDEAAPIREPGMRPTTQQPGFEITDTMRAAEIPLFSQKRAVDTESPEFKRWFGDSKVVDADGKPLVVYHGTAGDVRNFDPAAQGRNFFWRGIGGFFFTNRPVPAGVYAEKAADAYFGESAPIDFGTGTANVMPVYLSLQNPYIRKSPGSPDLWFDSHRDKLLEQMRANGHDGLIIKGGKTFAKRNVYLALKPEQIKSAISNTGAFDSANPDIAMSPARDRTNLDTANRRMSRFIDAFVAGDVKSNDTQILGPTPVVMRAVGAPDLSMEIDGAMLEKVLRGKHSYAITADMMKQLPDGLYDPIALFIQPEGGVRALTEMTTSAGNPVVVGVHFTVDSNRMKVNRIATVFEYERAGERFMEQAKNLRYVRNEEALKSSTTPATPFRAEVVQKARELGADFITEADLVKLYQPARYSPARGAITGQTIQPSWSFAQAVPAWDNFVRQMQDKQIDMKRIVAEIRKAGVAIKEQFDPYLQEILFHGRAAKRVEDFTTTELKPLFIEMQARGIEQREFDDYLWARHATERNAQIARVNTNMPDGGSGLTNQQAADILAGQAVTVAGRTIQLNPTHMAAYASLEARVRRITDNTLNLLVSSGLESQETVDAWRNAYKNYAPLMRDMESDDNFLGAFGLGLGTGQGFSVRGSSSKRATGSERAVVDVLANIAMQRERAITRAEKNRVAQAVYGLALTAPNTDFWLPVNPDARDPALQAAAVAELVRLGLNPIDAQNIASEPVQTYTDPRTGMVSQRINPMLRGRADVLALRVNGKDRYVFFSNDERAQHMVRNLKNLDDERLNGLMQAVAPVTRYFASINTQYNPVFGLTNGIRDLGTGMLNIGSTPIKGQRAKVLKYAASAMRGIFIDLREHRAGRQPQSQWALEFEEFQKEGGRTGYRDMFRTSEDRAKAIADEIKKAGAGESSWKVFSEDHPIGGLLSDYNTAIENAVRLAAYKAAKEDGHSPARAAEIAKNLTVNFNKKGQIATQAGALYAFFNAAVQGTARIGQTMVVRDPATGKWDLTATGKKIAYGGILLGSLQALMLAAAGYDDEEPPQFMRERNLILPLGYRGKYLTLPMPLGFHVLPNIGRVATELLLSGGRDPHKRLAQLVGTITDAFNPLGSSTPLQMLTPSVVDPLAALAENKDWSGKSIYKEDFNKLEPTAGWTRKKDTASDLSQWLSRSINYVSGGGKYGIGLSSPTPDQLDYLIGQATGGVGRESIKLWQSVKTPLSGEELPMYKIPVVGRFVGETTGQASEMSKFYENLKRIGEHDSALKEMKRARDTRAYIQYLKDNPDAQMIQLADRASRDMALLKRQKREAVEKGDKERVKLIEMQITGRVRQYNKKLAERQ